jgi:hypothetical protein
MRTTSGWIIMLGVFAVGICWAQPPLPPRARHADKNKDGVVGPRERAIESRVNTPAEARMDRNNNGRVDPIEAQKARDALKEASKVNRPWEAKADQNHDGRVDAVELRQFHLTVLDANGDGKVDVTERQTYWIQRKMKVNTPAEVKYDANGDGVLTGDEARDYIKDRLLLIRTEGRAKVSNPLEAEYDADNDGILQPTEAEIMKEAVGLP